MTTPHRLQRGPRVGRFGTKGIFAVERLRARCNFLKKALVSFHFLEQSADTSDGACVAVADGHVRQALHRDKAGCDIAPNPVKGTRQAIES